MGIRARRDLTETFSRDQREILDLSRLRDGTVAVTFDVEPLGNLPEDYMH